MDRALTVDQPSTSGPVLRRPVESDHARIIGVVDDWWGGRRMRQLLPRLWFRHFTGTSWVAEDPSGRLVGFAVAFISPDDPATGHVHLVGTDQNRRRIGIGRTLYRQVFADLAARDVRRIEAVASPDNHAAIAFHRALGFRIDDGPGTQRIYGTPAYPGYDGGDDDRVVFIRDL